MKAILFYDKILSFLNTRTAFWICAILFSLLIFGKIQMSSIISTNNFYQYYPDSSGYTSFGLSDPWKWHRSPGYPIFLAPFLHGKKANLSRSFKEFRSVTYEDLFKNKKVYEILNRNDLGSTFDRIAVVQALILILSMLFFFYAIKNFMHPLLAMICFIVCIKLAPPINPFNILTESLAQPLVFISLASILLFYKYHNWFYMYVACFTSAYTFLVRPVGLFMLILCTLYLAYVFICAIRVKKNIYKKVFISFALLFIGYAYILQLSILGGGLYFGTMQHHSNNMISFFYLEQDDVKNMPTDRSKEFTQLFLDQKQDFEKSYLLPRYPDFYDWEKSHSLTFRYNQTSWPYAYHGLMNVYRIFQEKYNNGKNYTELEKCKLSNEIKTGVYVRHRTDILCNRAINFIAGLGYFKDYPASRVAFREKGRLLILVGILSIIASVILIKESRFPIILLVSTHFLQIMACSFGGLLLDRYVRLTEPFFVFAYLFAMLYLLKKFVPILLGKIRYAG